LKKAKEFTMRLIGSVEQLKILKETWEELGTGNDDDEQEWKPIGEVIF
jgi:hypothetical protein